MKKIYEDEELILIDTENENLAFSIFAFYKQTYMQYSFLESIDLKYDDINEMDRKINRLIFFYCLKEKIYEKYLKDLKNVVDITKDEERKKIIEEKIEEFKVGIEWRKKDYGDDDARD